MNKIEALEWAADYAERNKLFAPVMNARGYTADGQKPLTPGERTEIIVKLANEVTDTPIQAPTGGGIKLAFSCPECGHTVQGEIKP